MAEKDRARDEVLTRMLKTPPKPHKKSDEAIPMAEKRQIAKPSKIKSLKNR